MKSELIIDVKPKEVAIAVLEDKRLVELQREKQNIDFSVGDIYIGKVRKIMPGLNAAFVDIGHKKEAFLHARDLGAGFLSAQKYLQLQGNFGKNFAPEKVKLEKEIEKDGAIGDRLKSGDEVMVQIVKEAISTKGPRVSAELSFAGRYLVLIPFSDKVSVSQKIRNAQERQRLKQLILSIKPANVSVIVRTSAEGVKVAELHHELRALVKKWMRTLESNVKKQGTPAQLHKETSRTLSLLRDTYTPQFAHIIVNDKELVEEIREYIELIDPGRGTIVELYTEKDPIFDHYEITKQVKQLFGRTVTYKKGAYLIIEQTEAMHVIDVNSGNRANGSKQQEDTAIDVNIAAADEIARQMRLRDLGGIIVIDFIDMGIAANRQKLFEHMNECMKPDRAKHTILPLTKFGLMQITRQRVRQALTIETDEKCPTCHGTGKVGPSIFFTDELEKYIEKLTKQAKVGKITLHVHPYVAAYVQRKKGFLGGSLLSKWRNRYSKGLSIMPDQSLGMLDYEFYDADQNDLSHVLDDE